MKFTSEDIKIYSYTGVIIFIYILYFLIFIGMGHINKEFVQKLNTIIQIVVGLFLFIKFFPYRNYIIDKGDVVIIFGCSTFILTNAGVTQYFLKNIETGVFTVLQKI